MEVRFGHFSALATATSYFSLGPMSASRVSSSHSSLLLVSMGDRNGDKLSTRLDAAAAGDGGGCSMFAAFSEIKLYFNNSRPSTTPPPFTDNTRKLNVIDTYVLGYTTLFSG